MCLNPESKDEIYDMYFKGDWLTNHIHKQNRTLFETNFKPIDENSTNARFVIDGGMENSRQQALYVELENDKVRTPSRITQEKTFALIGKVLQAFEASGDIGFSGFAAVGNSKSDWQFEEQITIIRSAYKSCASKHGKNLS